MPTIVIDEYGRQYELMRKIASGGQGDLHLDKTSKFLVKLLKAQHVVSREGLRRQIRYVKRMPLDDLPVTRPLALLREPTLGYVMGYIDGMTVFESLISPQQTDRSTWYINTGGLKGRLDILYECAHVLSRLHARGIVYGDLSPKNVLYSQSSTKSGVYLIDVDNLAYETDFTGRRVVTKFYGAPEVVSYLPMQDADGLPYSASKVVNGRQGMNTLTDSFSFAVLAFEALCSHHPLIGGDMVENGPPELEEAALAGRLPWVLNPVDKRNVRSNSELLYDAVLSPNTRKLFSATFEEGLLNPTKRPGMSKWADGLYRASRVVLTCPVCDWTYFAKKEECPNCKAEQAPHVIVKVSCISRGRIRPNEHNNTMHAKFVTWAALTLPSEAVITRRFLGDSGERADIAIMKIRVTKEGFVVTPRPDTECWVTSREWALGEGSEQGRKYSVSTESTNYRYSWNIRIGSLDGTHYQLKFEPRK